MIKKTDDFIFLEKCFGELKIKKDTKENLKRIERILNRIFDIDFVVSISENNTKEFFGMNIYPDVTTLDLFVESILADNSDTETILKIWQESKRWYLEIDSLLLYDNTLNANPAEMVAISLHEVGHIIYSNTVPQRVNKILRYKLMKLNYQMRQLVSNEKIRKLFNIAVVESCCSKNFTYINTKKERIADKFVLNYGYGENLNEFIDKLIRTNGNSLVNRSKNEMEQDITSIVNWSVNNIKELEFRKSNLRKALKVEIVKSPSEFVKHVVQDIYTSFFGESTDKYRELLSEQYTGQSRDLYSELQAEQRLMEHCKRITQEAFSNLFNNVGKVKKVSQTDIDIIRVEIDKIETNDDKIYLLDRVYIQLELVNAALDMLKMGKEKKVQQPKSQLLAMEKQLNEMREEILAVKIIDKEYGVFIRYPKGYQG